MALAEVQDGSNAVSWRVESPGVVVVTMHRPPANALGPPLLAGLNAAMHAAENTGAGQTRVLVLTSGVDGFFAAGADLKHLSSVDAASFTAYGDAMRAVNDRLAAAPWLSIAAVDGAALGGGLELAMSATMRVAGPRSSFGLPEVKLGLIPGAGGTQRLPRLIGRGRALDIILTGRQIPAREALAIGLVDRLTDTETDPGTNTNADVVRAALTLAAELTGASLPAQLAAVRAVDAAFDQTLADGLAVEVSEEQDLFERGEAVEGIMAFIERRRPNFG